MAMAMDRVASGTHCISRFDSGSDSEKPHVQLGIHTAHNTTQDSTLQYLALTARLACSRHVLATITTTTTTTSSRKQKAESK